MRQSIPSLLTSLRLIALPFLVYGFFMNFTVIVYSLFLFSIGTDLIDGYVARKLGVTSKKGAFFDVIADFAFVYTLFTSFILKGFYPEWIFLVLIFIFEQFILTNLYSKRVIYDPVGKYMGSLLYGGIGLTLLFPETIMFTIVTFGIVISTSISFGCRAACFFQRRLAN